MFGGIKDEILKTIQNLMQAALKKAQGEINASMIYRRYGPTITNPHADVRQLTDAERAQAMYETAMRKLAKELQAIINSQLRRYE